MSAEKGMGYVVSNRHEMDGSVEQIAFSYDDLNRNAIDRSKDYYLAEILNNKQRTNYSSTIFEED
jgi:uncharacterized protein (DUF433 family)